MYRHEGKKFLVHWDELCPALLGSQRFLSKPYLWEKDEVMDWKYRKTIFLNKVFVVQSFLEFSKSRQIFPIYILQNSRIFALFFKEQLQLMASGVYCIKECHPVLLFFVSRIHHAAIHKILFLFENNFQKSAASSPLYIC